MTRPLTPSRPLYYISTLAGCVIERDSGVQRLGHSLPPGHFITSLPLQGVSLNVTAVYNDSATHSLPATVNVISNTVLRMLNSSAGPISVISKPWPDLSVDIAKFQRGTFSSVMMLGFGLSMVPATFAVTVVKDRQVRIQCRYRHRQSLFIVGVCTTRNISRTAI